MADKSISKRSRRGSGAITLKDIARLAGVAPITVSRALNSPAQVSKEVHSRVQEAIERTAYVPNRMAGGLASSRSRLIAAVVPSMVFSVFNETIEALNGTLFDAGYQLMLGLTGYSEEREALLLDSVIGRRPDGILITGIMPPGRSRSRLIASGIPIVESWDLTPTPIDMLIGFSHQEIGRAVAQFLIKKGKRSFAIVTAGDERAQRRNTAFIDTVRALGLDVAICAHGSDFSSEVRAATGGKGIDLAVNLVGGSVFAACQKSLANFGRLAVVGYVDGVMKTELDLEATHGMRHEIFGVSNYPLSPPMRAEATRGFNRDVLPALIDGRIVPVIDRVYPFHELPEAKAYVEKGEQVGRVVVRID